MAKFCYAIRRGYVTRRSERKKVASRSPRDGVQGSRIACRFLVSVHRVRDAEHIEAGEEKVALVVGEIHVAVMRYARVASALRRTLPCVLSVVFPAT